MLPGLQMIYYDLNVPQELASTAYLKRLEQLGWGAVAINYTFTGKAPKELCPYVKNPAVGLKQCTRLTFVLDDPQQNFVLGASESIRSYDILAVRPTTERTFQIACQSLEVDIISLDLSEKLPFNIKHGLVREAVGRGIVFEISYGASVSNTGSKRRAALSAVMHLVRVMGKAKGLIVSSGRVSGEGSLRAPHCARNWVEMVGVKPDSSLTLTVDNAIRIIRHAGDRKWSVGGSVFKINNDARSDFHHDYMALLK